MTGCKAGTRVQVAYRLHWVMGRRGTQQRLRTRAPAAAGRRRAPARSAASLSTSRWSPRNPAREAACSPRHGQRAAGQQCHRRAGRRDQRLAGDLRAATLRRRVDRDPRRSGLPATQLPSETWVYRWTGLTRLADDLLRATKARRGQYAGAVHGRCRRCLAHGADGRPAARHGLRVRRRRVLVFGGTLLAGRQPAIQMMWRVLGLQMDDVGRS